MKQIVFSLRLARSKILLLYFIIIHSIMLLMLLALFGFSSGALLSLIVIASFIMNCQQILWLKGNRACICVERDAKGRWDLIINNGDRVTDLTLKNSVVTTHFILLRFSSRINKKTHSITVMKDAADPALCRQLRVYCLDPKTFQQ